MDWDFAADAPPPGWKPALAALWWLRKGGLRPGAAWEQAHAICQAHEGERGADVVHAWWVPAFAVKKDAVPGFINETWFTADTVGTYRGQCAELCGMDHAFMPIVVRVVSQQDYDAWLSTQRARVSALTPQ